MDDYNSFHAIRTEKFKNMYPMQTVENAKRISFLYSSINSALRYYHLVCLTILEIKIIGFWKGIKSGNTAQKELFWSKKSYFRCGKCQNVLKI